MRASDNILLTKVQVTVLDQDGGVLERGEAVRGEDDSWEFESQVAGAKIIAETWDRPKNRAELIYWIQFSSSIPVVSGRRTCYNSNTREHHSHALEGIMRTKDNRFGIYKAIVLLFVLFGLLSFTSSAAETSAAPLQTYDPTVQTPTLLHDEARTVYLGNLARRDNGVPPLRWNLQLTHAARWYSWDSTENRAPGFCGHQDTNGQWPSDRIVIFGYRGFGGAENAFCGYVTPEYAINGWMNSPGHRANLLDPNSREIGLGYYRRNSDGRGYVTQDFGVDSVYAPAVIENEAVSTMSPGVNLYIYNRQTGGGFTGLGAPITQMMVSNTPYFEGAAWEPYSANKAWTLTGGTGWRNVYVKTRDRFNRSATVSDAIYLGPTVPLNELGPAQMSTRQAQVTLYDLNGGALPQVQLSPGWLADDTNDTFGLLWGNGERVNDASAWGGTAFRLRPGNGGSSAWVYEWKFPIQNVPLVAYFRLKVNNNTSATEVASISVQGGPTVYGPLSLKGTDFAVANQYQEFALNFTFSPTTNDPFLIFNFSRGGDVDLYVDAVTIFSASQPVTSPLTWNVPGGNYRGQGIWVRYTNGTQFSGISEGITIQPPSRTISGSAGTAGAVLTFVVQGVSKTAISDSAGNYALSVPNGWSGNVTPSHACFTFSPSSRSYSNVTANEPSQDYTAAFSSGSGCANIAVSIGGADYGNFGVRSPGGMRASFTNVSNGPVKLQSLNALPVFGAERVIYRVNNVNTSFSELMGLPATQLNTTYWLPWYNNVDLDTQLRIANVSNATATVHVYVNTVEMTGSPFTLAAGESTRKSYTGVNNGPVQIVSDQNIVAAERVIYKVNGINTSFSEMMALPDGQLNNTYWLPWYNNVDLDTQLRLANASNATATVHIYVNNVEMQGSPFTLAAGGSARKSFVGVNNGPVQIVSDQSIVAAERVIYRVNNVNTSFTEMMALPNSQLNNTYWLPWYNNSGDLDTQLRIANVSGSDATVHVYIGGAEVQGSPFSLAAGASTRKNFANINNGPVQIASDQNIVVAERLIYKVSGTPVSFSEMMALPESVLHTTYWLPWYNNIDLDTQLRFGVP